MKLSKELSEYKAEIYAVNDLQELREINLAAQEILRITGKKIGEILREREKASPNKPLSFTYDRTPFENLDKPKT